MTRDRDREIERLERTIVRCARCPRLRGWCAEVARVKRRAFRDEIYWGKPVPGFGDPRARILLVGLAPAAHGANRTGRMFTGDASGEWLFAALHRAGLADRETSTAREDGLALDRAFVTAACRCAPPGNRPLPEELAACAPFLYRELELLDRVGVVVCLGRIAWDAILRRARRVDPSAVEPRRPAFGHGAEARAALRTDSPRVAILASYHPSRQNTQTGRLTRGMLDGVLARAIALSGDGDA